MYSSLPGYFFEFFVIYLPNANIFPIALQCIFPPDVSGILRIGDNFFCVNDLGVLIDNLTVDRRIFADECAGKNNTVADHSAFLDHASTSNDRILDGSLDQTSV